MSALKDKCFEMGMTGIDFQDAVDHALHDTFFFNRSVEAVLRSYFPVDHRSGNFVSDLTEEMSK